jgi:serine/threonine-protein kinase
LVPSDWQLQPPDPRWNGRRFISPDGKAWVAFYASPADHEPIAAHLKSVAFVDGEEITYLRGERDWIAISGVKGERVFYRKAVLACGGTKWHHAAFEYTADIKSSMDQIVSRSSRALESSRDYGCSSEASSFP